MLGAKHLVVPFIWSVIYQFSVFSSSSEVRPRSLDLFFFRRGARVVPRGQAVKQIQLKD